MDEQSAKCHKEICELYQRYQDLSRQLCCLQAATGELATETSAVGKRIIELYKASGNGLDGSPPGSA